MKLPHKQGIHFQIEAEKLMDKYIVQYDEAAKVNRKKAIKAMFAVIDSLTADIPKENLERVSCRKGCAHCCHINVEMSSDEAEAIAAYCKHEKIPIPKAYLEEQLKVPEDLIPNSELSACVFLKDNICTIYPVRPINCRKYLVYNKPELCNAKKYPHGRTEVCFSIDVELAASAVMNVDMKFGRLPEMMMPYSL